MVTHTQSFHLFGGAVEVHRRRGEPDRWYLRVVLVLVEAAYGVQIAYGSIAGLFDTVWTWRSRLLPCGVKGRACTELQSKVNMQQLSKALTTTFNMLAAEDMAAAAKVQLRDEAILGVDTI